MLSLILYQIVGSGKNLAVALGMVNLEKMAFIGTLMYTPGYYIMDP
jgi:hypothetical protein